MDISKTNSINSINSFVKTTIDDHGVALLELCRLQKRNALSQAVIDDLVSAISMVEKNVEVRAVVLTGSGGGPFSAGADLTELAHISTADAYRMEYLKDLSDAVASTRKPIVAAVVGLALGGGFELAMMCDIIYAAHNAKFGLPELTVGTIPGAGGTQRLTKIVGKYKAMEMILTSALLDGDEMRRLGVVSQTMPAEGVLAGALACARKIASQSAPIVALAKQAILIAEQANLDTGLKLERALYYSSFSLQDRTEGMAAFLEKRPPVFQHR